MTDPKKDDNLFSSADMDRVLNGVGTPPAAPPQPQAPAGAPGMTEQRAESSVLFSLSNLQGLASASQQAPLGAPGAPVAPGAPPTGAAYGADEASGIIDIRMLAGSFQQASSGSDGHSPAESLIAIGVGDLDAPVAGRIKTGMSTGLKLGIIGGSLVVLTVFAVVLIMLLRTPAPPQSTHVDEELAKLTAMLEKLQSGQKAEGQDQGEQAALQEQIAQLQAEKERIGDAGSDAKPTVAKASTGTKSSKPSSKPKSTASGSSTTKPSSAATKPAPSKKPASSGSSLDDLLGGGGTAKPSKPSTPSGGASGSIPNSLSKTQVKAGMKKVAGKVKACGKGASGKVKVKIKISNSGRVTSSAAVGDFAGTPTGTCAARAVRGARFPKFKKSSLTVTYPFKL